MFGRTALKRSGSAALVTSALTVLLSGCSEAPRPTMAVTVQGQVTSDTGASGPVRVRLYHAWSLEGDLRHPLQFIDEFQTRPGGFSHAFDYPLDIGEGLVVYAWQDLDGDGVFCTPSFRDELAGLTEAAEFPADTVTVEIVLTQPCAGPDWFYPAAAPASQ
jgi:hypothetical protein